MAALSSFFDTCIPCVFLDSFFSIPFVACHWSCNKLWNETCDRTALHVAVVRDELEVAALLLVNPGLSGLEVDDLCDPDE